MINREAVEANRPPTGFVLLPYTLSGEIHDSPTVDGLRKAAQCVMGD